MATDETYALWSLGRLLEASFTARELRAFLLRVSFGADIDRSIPENQSRADTAVQVAARLWSRGLVADALFNALAQELPHRTAALAFVRLVIERSAKPEWAPSESEEAWIRASVEQLLAEQRFTAPPAPPAPRAPPAPTDGSPAHFARRLMLPALLVGIVAAVSGLLFARRYQPAPRLTLALEQAGHEEAPDCALGQVAHYLVTATASTKDSPESTFLIAWAPGSYLLSAPTAVGPGGAATTDEFLLMTRLDSGPRGDGPPRGHGLMYTPHQALGDPHTFELVVCVEQRYAPLAAAVQWNEDGVSLLPIKDER